MKSSTVIQESSANQNGYITLFFPLDMSDPIYPSIEAHNTHKDAMKQTRLITQYNVINDN